MEKFDNLEDAAEVLGDGGYHSPNTTYNTVEEFVDDLVNLGNTDKVFAKQDDHLGLKDNLPSKFLNSPLCDVAEEFPDETEMVLDQVNSIIPLSKRELTEEDVEDIDEDKYLRGVGRDE
jgi:hypothetical protein